MTYDRPDERNGVALKAYAGLYEDLTARYGDRFRSRLATAMRGLISGSPALSTAERDRLIATLDRGEAASAKRLYREWDTAYLDFADEHDRDPAALAEVHRRMSASRLAAAVAAFTGRDCRDAAAFSSVMYELAAGLDWEDADLIAALRRDT